MDAMFWVPLLFIYLVVGIAFAGAAHGERCARGGWRRSDWGTFPHVLTETGFGMTMLFWPIVLTFALQSDFAVKHWRARHGGGCPGA